MRSQSQTQDAQGPRKRDAICRNEMHEICGRGMPFAEARCVERVEARCRFIRSKKQNFGKMVA